MTTQANLTGVDTLKFGTGTDTLTMSAGVTTFTINDKASFGGAAVSGLDIFQLANATNSVTVTSVDDAGVGGLGNATTGLIIKGGSATDEFTVATGAATATAGQQLKIEGGLGNDLFTLQGDIAGVHIDGGDADDTIKAVLANLKADATTIAGGNGTDTLQFTAAAIDDIAAAELTKLSSIEVLDLSLATAAAGKSLDLTSIPAGNVGITKVILPIIGAQTFTLKTELPGALEINAGTVAGGATAVDFQLDQLVSTGALNVTNGWVGATLDAIQTKGALSVNLGNDGDDTIAVKTGTGNVTFTGGDASDVVTVTVNATAALNVDASAAASMFTITGTAANQVIKGGTAGDTLASGAFAATITGGAGDDGITLNGTGVQTLVFASTGALNGKDTITALEAGNGVNADKINVTAFLSGGSFDTTVYSAATNADADIANKAVMFNSGAPLNAAGLAAEIEGAGNAFALNGKAIVFTGNTTAATNTMNVFFVNSALDGNAANVTAGDIVEVAVTGANFDLDTLIATNFVFA